MVTSVCTPERNKNWYRTLHAFHLWSARGLEHLFDVHEWAQNGISNPCLSKGGGLIGRINLKIISLFIWSSECYSIHKLHSWNVLSISGFTDVCKTGQRISMPSQSEASENRWKILFIICHNIPDEKGFQNLISCFPNSKIIFLPDFKPVKASRNVKKKNFESPKRSCRTPKGF